jgi:hypothetical protein
MNAETLINGEIDNKGERGARYKAPVEEFWQDTKEGRTHASRGNERGTPKY